MDAGKGNAIDNSKKVELLKNKIISLKQDPYSRKSDLAKAEKQLEVLLNYMESGDNNSIDKDYNLDGRISSKDLGDQISDLEDQKKTSPDMIEGLCKQNVHMNPHHKVIDQQIKALRERMFTQLKTESANRRAVLMEKLGNFQNQAQELGSKINSVDGQKNISKGNKDQAKLLNQESTGLKAEKVETIGKIADIENEVLSLNTN